jgi:hypothetical protein
MSGTDSLIQDFYTLQSGLVPKNIDSIYIDRKLSDNAIITNYYTRYLGKGRFSDLIKSDLDHVFTHKVPQLRPIIGSLGGGKSTLVLEMEKIARERYPDNAVVIHINMSDFGTIDPESLTRSVYQEIVKKLRPFLKDMMKDAGEHLYKPYFIPIETIVSLNSQDPAVEERAFRALLGSDKEHGEEIFYIINGLREFIINIFSCSNKMLVIIYDEVDIFVKLNKDKYPSTIDGFTYTFLRDFTDPRMNDKRPIYVAFTCEREMYEYIKNKCENFYRVAYNHEIIMKQFSDEELFELADKVYSNVIFPIFGSKIKIKQLPVEDLQQIINAIRTRPLLNETIPGYFLKDYLSEFVNHYRLDCDEVLSFVNDYEHMAYDEFVRRATNAGISSRFERNKVVQGYNFDGYADLLERGVPIRRAYGEFTTSEAKPQKVETFINWLNNLEVTGDYNKKRGDIAFFISPGITATAMERLKACDIKYVPFLHHSKFVEDGRASMKSNKNIRAGLASAAGDQNEGHHHSVEQIDHPTRVREFIEGNYMDSRRRKYKTIVLNILSHDDQVSEDDIKNTVLSMEKEGKLKFNMRELREDTYVNFCFN